MRTLLGERHNVLLMNDAAARLRARNDRDAIENATRMVMISENCHN